jgi:hypothetical protein
MGSEAAHAVMLSLLLGCAIFSDLLKRHDQGAKARVARPLRPRRKEMGRGSLALREQSQKMGIATMPVHE